MIATVAGTETIRTFAALREKARAAGLRRVGVAAADEDIALHAAAEALDEGIALPVLIGDAERIGARARRLGLHLLLKRAEVVASEEPAARAVELAREGRLDLILKGHLRTDELLRPVLDRERGLRTGRLLCDVGVFEFPEEDGTRLVGISDGGINVAPGLDEKIEIVKATVEVMHCLGMARPRVAVMSAVEVVSAAVPSTREAAELAVMGTAGAFGDADVYGPLALDNALMPWAARAKGIGSPVAGHADALIVPNLEAGNLLAKAVHFLAGWNFAHVVTGARVPVLIPSRVESARDKVNSMALGVVYAGR